MKKYVFALILSTSSFLSQAALLYSNGPVVDGSGLSVITSPSTLLGAGAQTTAGNSVAENFTIASGVTWTITDLDFFSYQSFATGFTFVNATWSIVSGDVNSGTIMASNLNALTNGGFQGYRVTSTTLANTDRSIYLANADIDDLVLGAGDYWLRWSLTGSAASGPWIPTMSDARTGNAQQSANSGLFSTLFDAGSQLTVELPFAINGSVLTNDVPEPAMLTLLGLGLLGMAGARRRKK
ncbi:PEP-CTERM sorting domain-containing protein [Paraglaciecola sp. 25GB23A]|uniref:PEP-CTERM sorting domain-containing protein n=1 Tax=Paraglaciecola sp. 25GB23A TaxID=3156068 RepID=UPI0032AEC4BB